MVVNEEIYLTLLAIVVIEEFMPVCTKFLSYNTFIYRSKIDAANVIKNWADIVVIKQSRKFAPCDLSECQTKMCQSDKRIFHSNNFKVNYLNKRCSFNSFSYLCLSKQQMI